MPRSFPDPVCILEGSASSRNSAVAGCYSKMVCMAGHFKMASMLKLVMMENNATPDDVINDKSASHILHKQFLGAHEPNLLDEDDMHIFGSKPMADPLYLVCCDTCQKPVKASQYAPHAERCSSRMVNPNNSIDLEDNADPMKPPKKGRKIKLTSNGNKKIYIKVKAKSQSENKNTVDDFELTNGNVNKPLSSTADQRLKAAMSCPESRVRDVPAPLATKMYHSHGNYRLRFELGQLYHESCAEQTRNIASNASLNSSQVNGLIPCDHSALHGSDNSVAHGARNIVKPQTKHLDQLPATTSEFCSGIPQKLSASGPSHPQASKSQRADTNFDTAVRNESARSRSNKMAVPSSKKTGKKKMQRQSVPEIRSSLE